MLRKKQVPSTKKKKHTFSLLCLTVEEFL